ncbi:hypothetical protein LOZ65_006286 [Ophidiomyces ophidiicola]|nr:hypothetical protein LOZ65_006286 [Ophidiomyces ophidiicola]
MMYEVDLIKSSRSNKYEVFITNLMIQFPMCMIHLFSTDLIRTIFLLATAVVLLFSTIVETYVSDRPVSQELFNSLDELARIVDITYCVGTIGIYPPFQCAGRCKEFKGFELVKTWNTGPLLSDSCGYLALSHPPWPKRVIVAFRGTYSIANTIVDLSAIPQTYVPYPGPSPPNNNDRPCVNCTVHAGFMTSWKHTRTFILKPLTDILARFPDYELTVVGHSLGGAVAALAGLEFHTRGWTPQITTFGEPRIGNGKLAEYLDEELTLSADEPAPDPKGMRSSFRRVTHINDPVPLLPPSEWGYAPHAGEVFISNPDLPPALEDLRHCSGDSDPNCSARSDRQELMSSVEYFRQTLLDYDFRLREEGINNQLEVPEQFSMTIPVQYKLWELFFAHRDYFWRLGVCLPKPEDWIPGWDDSKSWWKWKWKWTLA